MKTVEVSEEGRRESISHWGMFEVPTRYEVMLRARQFGKSFIAGWPYNYGGGKIQEDV